MTDWQHDVIVLLVIQAVALVLIAIGVWRGTSINLSGLEIDVRDIDTKLGLISDALDKIEMNTDADWRDKMRRLNTGEP